MGSAGARGAMLLAVAVILGIVLLQKFDSGTGIGTVSVGTKAETTSTTRRATLTTVGGVTSTTAARARAKSEYKVVVANGARLSGLATVATTTLKNAGFTTLTPADTTAVVDKTSIQFADGYEAEAREVAQALAKPATVVTRLSSPPVAPASLGDAKVVVILGTDMAGPSTSAPPTGGGTTNTTRVTSTTRVTGTTRP